MEILKKYQSQLVFIVFTKDIDITHSNLNTLRIIFQNFKKNYEVIYQIF
jgi:hypothetical protein